MDCFALLYSLSRYQRKLLNNECKRLAHKLLAFVVVINLLGFCSPCAAQNSFNSRTPVRVVPNYQFNQKTDSDIESLGEILAISQDSLGFMWFGGKNGIARHDGYNVKVFQHNDNDNNTISTNTVNDIQADDNGDVWVATYWGLNLYTAKTERFERFLNSSNNPRSLSHNSVLKLLKTRKGELWVGTDGGGLLRFDRARRDFDRFNADPTKSTSIASNSISALEEDDNGNIWVGLKETGVDIFDPKTLTVIKRLRNSATDHQSLSQSHPTDIERTLNGDMWVGTYWGLNRYIGNGKFKRYIGDTDKPNDLASSNINRLVGDASGRLWVGAGNQGLALYRPETDDFDRYLSGVEGKKITVSSFYPDNSGGLWLGYTPGGVARVNRYSNAFRNFRHEPGNANSLTNSDVLSVAEDKFHNLWVGTRDGLNYLERDSNKITRYIRRDDDPGSLPSQSVGSVAVDDENSVWVGTTWDGVGKLKVKTKKFKKYMADEANPRTLANREAWSLIKDNEGRIWVGTNAGGLHRYEPKTDDFFRYHFRQPGKNSSGRALSIDEDQSGALWLSTDDGLFRLKDENKSINDSDLSTEQYFEYFDQNGAHTIKPSIPVIRDVYEDSKRNIWLATEGGGVNKWNRADDTFAVYDEKDGLIHNTVSAIVEDNSGFMWFGTVGGISRFHPETETFKTFTKEHGLLGNVFSYPSAIKLASGEIAIGGMNGLTIIDPNELFTNTFQSHLVLTAFYLFNEPVEASRQVYEQSGILDARVDEELPIDSTRSPTSKFTLPQAVTFTNTITLRHDQSVFTFEYALLNYDVVEQNNYAYKLQGFDEDWTYSKARRTATYTNLDPGEYIFRVKAANNEGLWMDSELAVTLIVLPPWWATWWAYLCYCIAFFCFFAGIIYSQYSKRQFVEQQNKLLEEKVNESTRELVEKNEELQLAYKKMENASYSDQLTGLKNRRYLYNMIALDVAQVGRRFNKAEFPRAVADGENNLIFFLVDIDHFKTINDQYGHANGDIVLKLIAGALNDICRGSDLVLRWGGEKFLVVCRYCSRSIASQMAERIRKVIEYLELPLDNQKVIRRTCSVGYACYPFDIHNPSAVTMEQTINIADWCLYKVKHTGRNGWSGLELNAPMTTDIEKLMPQLEDCIANGSINLCKNK